MPQDKTLIVRAVGDDEAEVWVATSEDVPGLATEAATLNDLKTGRLGESFLKSRRPHCAQTKRT